jgi:hypothetical protein
MKIPTLERRGWGTRPWGLRYWLPGKWYKKQIPHPPGKTAGFGMTVLCPGVDFFTKDNMMDTALGVELSGEKLVQEIGAARNVGGGVLRVDANLCEVMR